MKMCVRQIAISMLLAIGVTQTCWAAGWYTGLTATTVISTDANGPVLEIITSQPINNSGGCSIADLYVLRDATNVSVVNTSLAIVMSAITTGLPIRLYVTGTCDSYTGRPLVSAVGLN
jgi:hypothetical protein